MSGLTCLNPEYLILILTWGRDYIMWNELLTVSSITFFIGFPVRGILVVFILSPLHFSHNRSGDSRQCCVLWLAIGWGLQVGTWVAYSASSIWWGAAYTDRQLALLTTQQRQAFCWVEMAPPAPCRIDLILGSSYTRSRILGPGRATVSVYCR